MGRRTKEIIYPHLNDCNGDVKGKWYVELSVLNKFTGEKIRHRIYEGFEKFSTDKEKRAYAEQIIREYTEKLNSGWRPFENDSEIEYNDTLAYHFSSTFSGKIKKISSISILFSEYLEWKKPSIKKSSYDDYKSKLRQFSLYLENIKVLKGSILSINNQVIINFLKMMSEEKGRARKTIGHF